jgi:DNA repair protein RadD
MMAGNLVPRTVADLLTRSAGRTAGIVFCVSVDHAEAVASELAKAGESVATVTGSTPKPERAKLIADFKARRIRWMVNVNVLTEGFDAPHIDTVAMLRPTKSPGLYYQMVGRGFRLAEGKADCLVLDYAGNVLEHGPVDAIRVRPKRAGGAAEVETGKAKECPDCHALLPIATRVCECGYAFTSGEPKHFDRALDLPILSAERTINRFEVRRVRYERHEKPDKPPSLRVTYLCGLRTFREWICLEHAGMARAKAHRWWSHRVGGEVPRTVDEALLLTQHLAEPLAISVDETNKFPEITNHEFDEAKRERARATNPVSATSPARTGSPASADAVPGVRPVPQWLLRAMESGDTTGRAA